MDKEEKEFFRIRTDIQILLAFCLIFIVLAGASLIAYYQTINSVVPGLFFLFVFFAFLALISALGVAYYRGKMYKI